MLYNVVINGFLMKCRKSNGHLRIKKVSEDEKYNFQLIYNNTVILQVKKKHVFGIIKGGREYFIKGSPRQYLICCSAFEIGVHPRNIENTANLEVKNHFKKHIDDA